MTTHSISCEGRTIGMKSSTLEFLRELENNNDRSWFEKHRFRYEDARADFQSFFENLVNEVAKFDQGVAQDPQSAKKFFRIYRDPRFSRDKSPYKAHLSGAIVPGGMRSGRAGYYVHIEPDDRSMAAGGMHQLDSKNLLKVRKALSSRFDEFRGIVESDVFIGQFGSLNRENTLKRVPSGFDPFDPSSEYLKLKSFDAWREFTDGDVLQKDFMDAVVRSFKAIKDLNDFLDSAL
jgi:uncharacterized protein (TIGR02453 family)